MVNKYHNKKVIMDGIEFDSRKEANRWFELRMLERAGEIQALQRQVKYILIPKQIETYERYGKTGKRLSDGEMVIEQECAYFADFVYVDNKTKKLVVEDTKGYRDPSSASYAKFVIKRKLMLERFGIRIKEI